ncbi:MAG: acyl-CoA thioesterase [Bernardetiaceae bacterium]
MNPTAQASRSQVKVRNFHLDFFQHVNNTRYLEFLEEARWAFFEGFEQVWYAHLGRDAAFVVVNINIDYLYPATIGDVLNIDTRILKLGGSSAVFEQMVSLAGKETPVAKAQVTLVLMDARTQKAVPIPNAIREVLSTMTSGE